MIDRIGIGTTNPKFNRLNHRSDHQGIEPGNLSTRQVHYHYATHPLLFFIFLHPHRSQKSTSVAHLHHLTQAAKEKDPTQTYESHSLIFVRQEVFNTPWKTTKCLPHSHCDCQFGTRHARPTTHFGASLPTKRHFSTHKPLDDHARTHIDMEKKPGDSTFRPTIDNSNILSNPNSQSNKTIGKNPKQSIEQNEFAQWR